MSIRVFEAIRTVRLPTVGQANGDEERLTGRREVWKKESEEVVK